jgi:AcrR family transcriptional regulator
MRDATVIIDKRPSGRPRNEATRVAILATTMEMLQHSPLQVITIEAIAKAAGVSKATIYRWWPSKVSVVIDAFIEHHIVKTPMRRDLPPTESIALHMRSLIQQYDGFPGRVVAQILAEGQSDPEVLREWRERFYYGRRAVVREMMEEWKRQVRPAQDIDLEFLMDMIYAPIYQRLLLRHAPLDTAFADRLTALMTEFLEFKAKG